jgi:hypothetical protein
MVELAASPVTVAIDSIEIVNGNCVFQFKSDLTDNEVLELEQVVFAHSGEPLPANPGKVELYVNNNRYHQHQMVSFALL